MVSTSKAEATYGPTHILSLLQRRVVSRIQAPDRFIISFRSFWFFFYNNLFYSIYCLLHQLSCLRDVFCGIFRLDSTAQLLKVWGKATQFELASLNLTIECIGGGRQSKVRGLGCRNAKLIIHEPFISLFWAHFSRWRVRGNELSRAEQGVSKATSGNLTATQSTSLIAVCMFG